MDAAVELAKCREAAEKLVPTFAELGTGTIEDRIATALLAARADALREFTSGWDEPELCYIAEELEREAQGRRMRGL
jgi:hypothetical protein